MTGRKWKWSFSKVVLSDEAGMTDVIKELNVVLSLYDYDLDMIESNTFPCSFDSPEEASFIEYGDLTPEILRGWAISQHASEANAWPHGEEAWVERQKQILVSNLEARAARRTATIRGTIEETL